MTYDTWKLATPPEYDITPEEERWALQEQLLRDAIACALADNRAELSRETVRFIVLQELERAA